LSFTLESGAQSTAKATSSTGHNSQNKTFCTQAQETLVRNLQGNFELKETLEQKDLPSFVTAFDMLYQKEKKSATGNGDQSKPEADDADTGGIYYDQE
jgi:hypothetical protein